MKALKIFSIITVILQIVSFVFVMMLGTICEYLPFDLELALLALLSVIIMASPMLIGIMLIIIIIHCLVLGALMNKGTELFKKVVMITYLVYGIFIVVYSILQYSFYLV